MSALQVRKAAGTNLVVVPYRRVSVAALATNIVLVLLGSFFLLPMLWMVFASVDSNPDWAIKLPSLTFANFTDVLGTAGALTAFRSSLILAGTTTAITTVLAVLAAYPLSRRSTSCTSISAG
jgi:multiple sugar transport system permease protein